MKRAPLLFPTACSCTLWSQGRVEDGERWLRSQPRGPLGRWPGLQGLLPELQPETACYSGSFGPRQVFRASPVGCGPPVRLCFAGVGLAYPGKDCRSVHELAVCWPSLQGRRFILVPTKVPSVRWTRLLGHFPTPGGAQPPAPQAACLAFCAMENISASSSPNSPKP